MHINRKFATLGVAIILVPFLGVPDTWKYFFIVFLGLAVIFTGIDFPRPKKKQNRRKTDVNGPHKVFEPEEYPQTEIKGVEEEVTPSIYHLETEDNEVSRL